MSLSRSGLNWLVVFLLVFTACSSDDNSPPKAGFEISDNAPVQWDVVGLYSYANGDKTFYRVTGGDFVLEEDMTAIVFLDSGPYTITQITKNAYGEDTLSIQLEVVAPDNKYTVGDTSYRINVTPEVTSITGDKTEIRFDNAVLGQGNPDRLLLLPVNGGHDLPAKYLYDGTGNPTGTYVLHLTKNFNATENTYDWTMDYNGSDGDGDLIIDLIYRDSENAVNNAYEIRITEYSLSTGYFDFFGGGGFVEVDKKPFTIYYRGKMNFR